MEQVGRVDEDGWGNSMSDDGLLGWRGFSGSFWIVADCLRFFCRQKVRSYAGHEGYWLDTDYFCGVSNW